MPSDRRISDEVIDELLASASAEEEIACASRSECGGPLASCSVQLSSPASPDKELEQG
jgi:hypothetical protein